MLTLRGPKKDFRMEIVDKRAKEATDGVDPQDCVSSGKRTRFPGGAAERKGDSQPK